MQSDPVTNVDSASETASLESLSRANPASGIAIGPYKLLEKIGEGGFGEVWLAEQKEPVKRRVAVKIIKLGMDTKQVVARFEAERQALALMDHPNIAKVLDAGATDLGRPYFVMEHVKGVPITDYCNTHKLDTTARLHLFIQICRAIQHAHQKGIIHRDIKPSNILVTMQDGAPVPKVIDFGIAKATQMELTEKTIHTQLNQFIGTPAYMSPEQAEMTGIDIDTRSDIYSLGVLLYELLTGSTPFDSKELLSAGLEEMRRIIREREPVRPSTRASNLVAADSRRLTSPSDRHDANEVRDCSRCLLPKELIATLRGDLDWIILKCLEKDRTRRYETANGLAADLERYLGNEPVIARPPNTAYKLSKAIRRNRLAFAAGGMIAVTLIAGLAVSLWQAAVARRASLDAVVARNHALVAQTRAETGERTAQRLLYAANLNLMDAAWSQNNGRRLRELLDETSAYPDRGFEWRYWKRLADLDNKVLRAPSVAVPLVAFSNADPRVIAGFENKVPKIWDAFTGHELAVLKGSGEFISAVALASDSQKVVVALDDGNTATVWDAATGEKLFSLEGHTDKVTALGISSNDNRIVTASRDGTARIWDAETGRHLRTLRGHKLGLSAAAWFSDGKRIVTGSYDNTAIIWAVDTGAPLQFLESHQDEVWSVAVSSDGQRVLTGSSDRTAKLWDAATGQELPTLAGHTDRIISVAFSLDGQRAATGAADFTAKVWDVPSGRELLSRKGDGRGIATVSFLPGSHRLITGSSDGSVKLWEAGASPEVLTLASHTAEILSAVFSPDSKRIATAGRDLTARLWDAASGKELLTFQGHEKPLYSVAFSPDGSRIVTGSFDNTARVWDPATGQALRLLSGHVGRVSDARFSPDGRRIITGSRDATAKIWDALTGAELLTLSGHYKPIMDVFFSRDSQQAVTSSLDGTIRFWDVRTGRELRSIRREFLHPSTGHIALSPDGRLIASAAAHGAAEVWETATGRRILSLRGHNDLILSLAFSPDSSRIVTGSWDQTARVWDAESGQILLTLKGHAGGVRAVNFSSDGARLLTGAFDRTAKVWLAAPPEKPR